MGLTALLPEIDKKPDSVFVMHEKSEKLIPLHRHTKGQLSYVEGGIAYVEVDARTFVVPARHYLWIPKGVAHVFKVGYSATVFRSLYFYSKDDGTDPFYSRLGIYPASELLIQMIAHTERWDGRHVGKTDPGFEFLIALKKLLPTLQNESLSIVLPTSEDERLNRILKYMERSLGEKHTLGSVASEFNLSERSLSRLFQSNLHVSFLQYLKTLRIIKALEMLLKTRKTISEIAYGVGYDTVGAFSNSFYLFTRLRPSDLRKHK